MTREELLRDLDSMAVGCWMPSDRMQELFTKSASEIRDLADRVDNLERSIASAKGGLCASNAPCNTGNASAHAILTAALEKKP